MDPADIIDGMPHVGKEVCRHLLHNLRIDFSKVARCTRTAFDEFSDYECEA